MRTFARAVFAVACAASPALAQEVSWSNPLGGAFQAGANWSGGAAPTAAQTAVFALSAPGYAVSLASNAATAGLRVVNDPLTLDLAGFRLDVVGRSPDALAIADASGAAASLALTGGGTLATSTASIATGTASIGTLSVAPGVAWSNSGSMTVGDYGAGTLHIAAGGTLNSGVARVGRRAGAAGVVLLDGGAWNLSGQLLVGSLGAGTIHVVNGARLNDIDGSFISAFDNASGFVRVSGAGSRWTSTLGVYVGHDTAGTLTIENGGEVLQTATAFVPSIGNLLGSSGSATLRDPGSRWTVPTALVIGYRGSGTLRIEDGGLLATAPQPDGLSGAIGLDLFGVGTVAVSGTDARWQQNGNLAVGFSGRGRLDILAGGFVEAAAAFVAQFPEATGSVTIDGAGSTLQTLRLFVGGDGTASGGTATLVVRAGGTAVATLGTRVWNGGRLRLEAGGSLNTSSLTLVGGGRGEIAPGSGAAVRVAALEIDALSRLDLADGALIVDYAPGAAPIAQIAAYVGAGYAAGAWTGPGIASSLAAAAGMGVGFADTATTPMPSVLGHVVDATSVVARLTFYGDANLDGRVDVADLGILASAWQSGAFWGGGDFTYDTVVDVADLGALASNWQAGVAGPTAPGASLASAWAALSIPEPSAAAIATGLLLARRRRRRG